MITIGQVLEKFYSEQRHGFQWLMCEIHLNHKIRYGENKIVQCDWPWGVCLEVRSEIMLWRLSLKGRGTLPVTVRSMKDLNLDWITAGQDCKQGKPELLQ